MISFAGKICKTLLLFHFFPAFFYFVQLFSLHFTCAASCPSKNHPQAPKITVFPHVNHVKRHSTMSWKTYALYRYFTNICIWLLSIVLCCLAFLLFKNCFFLLYFTIKIFLSISYSRPPSFKSSPPLI